MAYSEARFGMVKIYHDNYFYEQYAVNDNLLIQAPVYVGFKFMGFQPVKGNWKRPEEFVEVLV